MDDLLAFLRDRPPQELAGLLQGQGALVAGAVLTRLPPALQAQIYSAMDASFRAETIQAARFTRDAPPAFIGGVASALQTALAAQTAAAPPSPTPAPAAPKPSSPPSMAGGYPPARPGQPLRFVPRDVPSTPPASSAARNAPPPATAPAPHKIPPAARPSGKPQILGDLSALLRRPPAARPPHAPAAFGASGAPDRSASIRAAPRSIAVPNAQAARKPRMFGALDSLRPRPGGRPAVPRAPAPAPTRARTPGQPTSTAGARSFDGMGVMAAILRESDPAVRSLLAVHDPALFAALKKRMFVYDDLVRTNAKGLSRIFAAAATRDAALALQFSAPELRERVFDAVGARRARIFSEMMDAGRRLKVADVEAAQQRILDIALEFQRAGVLLIDPADPDLLGERA